VPALRAWLPRGARESLDLLRRPGLSHLERCLAASLLVGELKAVLARGPASATFVALVKAEIQRQVGDLVDGDLDTGNAE
jgi:hypothetical protein